MRKRIRKTEGEEEQISWVALSTLACHYGGQILHEYLMFHLENEINAF